MLPREGVYECHTHERSFERHCCDSWCGVSGGVLLYIHRHGAYHVSSRVVLSSWRGFTYGVFCRVVLSCRVILSDTVSCRVLLSNGKSQDTVPSGNLFSVDRCVICVSMSGVSRWFVLSERLSVGDDVSGGEFLSDGFRCIESMHGRVLLSDDDGTDSVPGCDDVCGRDVVELRHRMRSNDGPKWSVLRLRSVSQPSSVLYLGHRICILSNSNRSSTDDNYKWCL